MKTKLMALILGGILVLAANAAWAEVHEVEVRNLGSDGQRMVFEPALVEMAPGDTVRFVWKDMGHNAASYDPDNRGKPKLVPDGAKSWDSGFLQPGDTYEVTLEAEGAHHYFCLPHEGMGMVGIIAVGDASKGPGLDAVENADIPDGAKKVFRELHDQLEE
jgi:pseudoazurin